jgi:hypothetical protein
MPTNRMLNKSSSFVLTSLTGSTYGKEYASPLHSLRPYMRIGASWRAGVGWVRSTVFLNILRDLLIQAVTSKRSRGSKWRNSFSAGC